MKRDYLVGGMVVLVIGLIGWAIAASNSGSEESETAGPSPAAIEAHRAEMQSALKNAATAMESYATRNSGVYAGAGEEELIAEGLQVPPGISFVEIQSDDDEYCFVMEHQELPTDDPWRLASFNYDPATPSEADSCS